MEYVSITSSQSYQNWETKEFINYKYDMVPCNFNNDDTEYFGQKFDKEVITNIKVVETNTNSLCFDMKNDYKV